jgi:hypothetical protein
MSLLMLGLGLTGPGQAADEVRIKPFTLAQYVSGIDMDSLSRRVRARLKKGGFQIVGTYNPYPGARVFVITSAALRRTAAKTRYGGFGAALRVSLTQDNKGIQVSHNNPNYLGLAYNMGSRLNGTRQQLKNSLGFVQDFGGNGVPESKLPEYNYTFGLEGFTGFYELGTFASHREALQKVEQGLANNDFGIGQVYKVKIPGKQQVLIGISMQADSAKEPFLNDKYVMEIIDYQPLKRTAHLPYELLVDGKRVIALHAHYRLAVNFPDLHMFGKHSFGKLMDLPYVYEEYFTKAIGSQWPPPDQDW